MTEGSGMKDEGSLSQSVAEGARSPRASDAEPSGAWTPGPWYVDHRPGRLEGYSAISAAGWSAFAEVVTRFSHESDYNQTGRANARLIAAAPDLFEALKETHRLISAAAATGFTGEDECRALFVNQGRVYATLAKAEGRANPTRSAALDELFAADGLLYRDREGEG